MKNISDELRTAIESGERVIFQRFTVDFDGDGITDIDDLSRKVSSLRKNHVLTSDLPARVRTVPGVAVAELDVKLNNGYTGVTEIPAFYRSISTASSGASATKSVTVPAPSGMKVDDIVLLIVVSAQSASPLGIPNYANADWASLAWRGDLGDSTYAVGHALMRRVATDEPLFYEFKLDSAVSWVATAICVGDANIDGLHTYQHRGTQDGDPSTTITGVDMETTLSDCTIVQVYAANVGATVGPTWTAAPHDTTTSRATVSTSAASNNVAMTVRTLDDAPAATYSQEITLSVATDANVAFQFAFAPKTRGNELQHAAWTFSELNPRSPYAGKIRFGRKTRWDVGFATANGVEYVPFFTGLTLDSGASSRSRGAEMSVLDNRETLRNTARDVLGILVAEWPDDVAEPKWPGLDATYVISKLFSYSRYSFTTSDPFQYGPANGNGYFASYPINRATVLHVPAHGSLDAFEGFCSIAYTQELSGRKRRPYFRTGPFVSSTEAAPQGGFVKAVYNAEMVDFWNVATSQSAGRVFFMARRTETNATMSVFIDGVGTTGVEAEVRITSAGVIELFLRNDHPLTRTVTGPTITDDEWHFVGVHWNSVAGQATFRLDNVELIVAFTTWSDMALSDVGGETITVTAEDGMQWAELQAQRGATETVPDIIVATDAWVYDTFSPTAFIDHSILILDALPVLDATVDVWEVVSAIADAEFAAAYFDDYGYPHYRTGQSDASDAGQAIAKELHSRTSIEDISYVRSARQIANKVSVEYTPYELHYEEVVWGPGGTLVLPPFATVVIEFTVGGPILGVGIGAFGDSNTSPDGSGTVIPDGYGLSAGNTDAYTMQVTLTSYYYQAQYLVDTSGNPNVTVTATWYAPTNEETAPYSLQDSASIRKYGEQPLGVSTSEWRQRRDVASSQALKLVTDLAEPAPVIQSMPIVGDPTLEFGDMCTVEDVNGIGVNGLFRVTGISSSFEGNAKFNQTLVLRETGLTADWNESDWGDTDVWGP